MNLSGRGNVPLIATGSASLLEVAAYRSVPDAVHRK